MCWKLRQRHFDLDFESQLKTDQMLDVLSYLRRMCPHFHFTNFLSPTFSKDVTAIGSVLPTFFQRIFLTKFTFFFAGRILD